MGSSFWKAILWWNSLFHCTVNQSDIRLSSAVDADQILAQKTPLCFAVKHLSTQCFKSLNFYLHIWWPINKRLSTSLEQGEFDELNDTWHNFPCKLWFPVINTWNKSHNDGPVSWTHWGRVTHICVSKLIIIGSDNDLSPGRHQANNQCWNIVNWTLGKQWNLQRDS